MPATPPAVRRLSPANRLCGPVVAKFHRARPSSDSALLRLLRGAAARRIAAQRAANSAAHLIAKPLK